MNIFVRYLDNFMVTHFDIITIFEPLWQIGMKLCWLRRWLLPFFWCCTALSFIKWQWLKSIMDGIPLQFLNIFYAYKKGFVFY